MSSYYRVLITISLLLLSSVQPAWGVTDQQILADLEAMEDLEAAYPLAWQLAEQANTYQSWRNLATKYAVFDTNSEAYRRAWLSAKQLDQIAQYQDFMAIRPQSAMNFHAVRAIYKHIRAKTDIDALLDFIETFPDSVEAIEAMLAVQQLAFDRAKQAHDPAVYDAFVTTFPGALQIPVAMELAFTVERDRVAARDAALTDAGDHERLARRLFNEGRTAERDGQILLATRNYRLLELPLFKDTQVYTEMLDREERQAYQKLMTAQQADIRQSVETMRLAVVDTIQAQSAKLEQTLTQAIEAQGDRLEDAMQAQEARLASVFTAHNEKLDQQLAQLENQDGSIGVADVIGFIPGVAQVRTLSKLGKIVGKFLPWVKAIARNPTVQQARLLH